MVEPKISPKKPFRSLCLVTSLFVAVTGCVAAEGGGREEPRADSSFLRGMTVSCPRWGPIWGTPDMDAALEDLRSLGVEWVAVHPYAGVRRDGSLRIHPTGETKFLDRAVSYAADRGIQLFWKPHLAYWGSFSWRGAIAFDTQEAWDRFFTDYRAFIVDQASFAQRHEIPLLAVGVELDLTLDHEASWRAIIRDVRKVYSGQLTYAANWDAVEKVPFWDALDLIGVQAYYPMAAESAEINVDSLSVRWDSHLDSLSKLSEAEGGKRILFTEIGYSRSAENASQPWKSGMEASPAVVEQRRRLLDAALSRLEAEPMIAGLFWWKWMPGDVAHGHDGDFSMKDRESRDALKKHWAH